MTMTRTETSADLHKFTRIYDYVLNRLSIVSVHDVNQISFGVLNYGRIAHFDWFLLSFPVHVHGRQRTVVKVFEDDV